MIVPDDGREHPCVCGRGALVVWDGDGWMRHNVVVDTNRTDVDCSGIVDECDDCGEPLEVA